MPVKTPDLMRVYCAGGLFCEAERREMTEIADLLCGQGFQVYLPHRDGMEFRLVLEELTARGWTPSTAASFLHAAIFALDIYQLVAECGSLVWNLNGRVPDEGAVSEAAIAWTLGRPMVGYKDDVRSLIAGRDNPLLAGLLEFEILKDRQQIPAALNAAIGRAETQTTDLTRLPARVRTAVHRGQQLWVAMQTQGAEGDNVLLADVVSDLFASQAVS